MEWLGDALGFLGAAATGGLTGILGLGVKGLFGWLEARTEIQKLTIMQNHELALQKLNIEARGQELEREAQIAQEETLRASYGFQNLSGQKVWTWVASFSALIRPVLTLYLVGLITWFSWKALPEAAKVPVTPDLVREIIQTVLYLGTAAVLWWFGSRPTNRH